jgi:AmmeMemoRadiSam system protein A
MGEGLSKNESAERGRVLLALAREALEEKFGRRPMRAGDLEPWLEKQAATFVTLRKAGELRGCIGTLTPRRSLFEDVRENARSAAFNDPRFPELTVDELEEIEIDVSLLSPVEPIDFDSEEDLLEQLRPGVDGLVLEEGFHRGTFLPQVWDQLPKPRDFLRHLKRKAGLEKDFWSEDVKVSRYTVEEWGEEGVRRGG